MHIASEGFSDRFDLLPFMEKELLRKIYRQKRRELNPYKAELLSQQIAENFKKALSFDKINYLHTFYPIHGKVEVNTLLICNYIRKSYPQVRLILSKSNLRSNTLNHFVWQEDTPLTTNSWGILEPEGGEEVNSKDLDVILVPLLAFDKEGNRVGYGKGFYDRFLKEIRADALKIGLSFFNAVSGNIDACDYDVPLNSCITPASVYSF